MGLWDILLIISVSVMGTAAAFLRSPRYKALIICIPLPFTFATLAVGENVNSTHVLGLLVLLGFWFLVYYLKNTLRLPITVAVATGAVSYCILGIFLAKTVPKTETTFAAAAAAVCFVAFILHNKLPYKKEPGHSTRMPVWIKASLLLLIVSALIAIKSLLGGFMTVFPMVGVLAAYESRHSLWTSCRQVPLLMFAMACMMSIIHIFTPVTGIYPALALGWVTMISTMAFLLRHHWGREQEYISSQSTKEEYIVR